jgi:hypothetical protein
VRLAGGDGDPRRAVCHPGDAWRISGPECAPFGYASAFVPTFLFYELTEMRTLEQAMERLCGHDDELAMWRLFRAV